MLYTRETYPVPWWSPPFPDPETIEGAVYLDNNHWEIPESWAKKLCEPYGLPRPGYERIINFQDCRCYVRRDLTILSKNRKEFVKPRAIWVLFITNRHWKRLT